MNSPSFPNLPEDLSGEHSFAHSNPELTKRLQAEERLRQREYQLAEAQRITHIGSWSWDLETDTLTWSDELFRIFGLEPCEAAPKYEELQKKHIHPEDVQLVDDQLQLSFRTGVHFDFVYRLIRPDGETRYLHAIGEGIKNEEGKSILFFGTAQDITEQKVREDEQARFNEALRASEERYRLMFENNPIPMWAYDLETFRFLEVNNAAVEHYGFSRDEFLAMKITDIRTPEEAQELERHIASIDSPLSQLKLWKHRKKDGSIISVEITAHSIELNGRKGRLVLANDVTERKTLENQLKQVQKLESIGLLAGGIAHDFNNLLTVINGYSSLVLVRMEPDNTFRQNIKDIHEAGERAELLTKQLLAFSRKQILEPKVLNLNTIVSDIEKMLRRIIGENIDFRSVLAEDLQNVSADPGQIEQILMNLVVNSRDAMPKGGKLTIETANVTLDEEYARTHISVSPGSYVMLAVSDTGMGMDEETRQRVFEPFFTTKAVGHGTGLGLSTAYGIVKQSGGNIWVYSEPGRGTTFKVYLPVVRKPEEKVVQHQLDFVLRGTETILLVEDDEAVRTFTTQVLETFGYRVLAAAEGKEAIEICESKSEKIDLLLTDVVMPRMSGRELATAIGEHCSNVKVLYMSGYTDAAVLHQGEIDEHANFIHKPFQAEALARKIRSVLDSKE